MEDTVHLPPEDDLLNIMDDFLVFDGDADNNSSDGQDLEEHDVTLPLAVDDLDADQNMSSHSTTGPSNEPWQHSPSTFFESVGPDSASDLSGPNRRFAHHHTADGLNGGRSGPPYAYDPQQATHPSLQKTPPFDDALPPPPTSHPPHSYQLELQPHSSNGQKEVSRSSTQSPPLSQSQDSRFACTSGQWQHKTISCGTDNSTNSSRNLSGREKGSGGGLLPKGDASGSGGTSVATTKTIHGTSGVRTAPATSLGNSDNGVLHSSIAGEPHGIMQTDKAVLEQQKMLRAKVTARMKSKRKRELGPPSASSLASAVPEQDHGTAKSPTILPVACSAAGSKTREPAISGSRIKTEPDSQPATGKAVRGDDEPVVPRIKKEVLEGQCGNMIRSTAVSQTQKGTESTSTKGRANKRRKKEEKSAMAKGSKAAAAKKKSSTSGSGIDKGEDEASEPMDPAECKKQRRLIRNRMSAQLHRERQKAHVTDLENKVKQKEAELAFSNHRVEEKLGENARLVAYASQLEMLLFKHHIAFERPHHVNGLLPKMSEMGLPTSSHSPSYSSDTTPCPSSPEDCHLSSIVCSRGPPSPCRGGGAQQPTIKKERSNSDDSDTCLSDQTSESSAPPPGNSSVLVLAVMFTMLFFGGNALFDPNTSLVGTSMVHRSHRADMSTVTITSPVASPLGISAPTSEAIQQAPQLASLDIVDISAPRPHPGNKRSLQAVSGSNHVDDAIPLPPPLSPEKRVSTWGSKGAGPVVLSHDSATPPERDEVAAISKQLQLYRDQRIQGSPGGYTGRSPTNATSWMMCPQTYGGVGLNVTVDSTAADHEVGRGENLRHGSQALLPPPSEWKNEHGEQSVLEFDREDAYLLLLVPSTSVTWGEEQNASGEYYRDMDDSGWIEIGCEMMHVRRVPGAEFSDLV